jgi:hypothetical protein
MTELVAEATQAMMGTGRQERSWNYRLGHLVVTHYWFSQLFVMALMTVNVFWRLSSTVISSMDEARYGVAASEMLNAREQWIPTYGGLAEYWNLKPPLGYWLIEASYALFGRTVWALRLTSALCALGAVMLTMAFCRRWFGRRAAILAGLFVTTCFGFLSSHGARSGDLDAALTLILLLALIQVPNLRDSQMRRLAWGLLLALGFLLKSFAILPFALAAVICLAWTERERVPWRQWVPAVVLFAGIVGSWALVRTIKDGTAYFVIRMTYEDLFMRSTHLIDSGSYSLWGYAIALFDRFAPWPVIVILSWGYQSRGAEADKHEFVRRLLVLWAFVPLCLFSLARTQHHWYLDPTYPAWAILAAVALLAIMRSVKGEFGRSILLCVAALALTACEVRLLGRVAVSDRRPSSQLFLASLRNCQSLRGEPLYAAFSLSHSERFILQVMDGFDVGEPGPDANRMDLPQRPSGLVLYSKHGHRAPYYASSDPSIVAQSEDYLLIDRDVSTDSDWSTDGSPSVAGATAVRVAASARYADLGSPALNCAPGDAVRPAMRMSGKASEQQL